MSNATGYHFGQLGGNLLACNGVLSGHKCIGNGGDLICIIEYAKDVLWDYSLFFLKD